MEKVSSQKIIIEKSNNLYIYIYILEKLVRIKVYWLNLLFSNRLKY